jgi:hypothetical protein
MFKKILRISIVALSPIFLVSTFLINQSIAATLWAAEETIAGNSIKILHLQMGDVQPPVINGQNYADIGTVPINRVKTFLTKQPGESKGIKKKVILENFKNQANKGASGGETGIEYALSHLMLMTTDSEFLNTYDDTISWNIAFYTTKQTRCLSSGVASMNETVRTRLYDHLKAEDLLDDDAFDDHLKGVLETID